MAGRVIAQLIVQGVSIFGRAFFSAYQQALHNAKTSGVSASASKVVTKFKLQADEAMRILNIEKHELNKQTLEEKYKLLFEANNPAKGGSFYLQSKVFRSKEVLDYELNKTDTNDTEAKTQSQDK